MHRIIYLTVDAKSFSNGKVAKIEKLIIAWHDHPYPSATIFSGSSGSDGGADTCYVSRVEEIFEAPHDTGRHYRSKQR